MHLHTDYNDICVVLMFNCKRTVRRPNNFCDDDVAFIVCVHLKCTAKIKIET